MRKTNEQGSSSRQAFRELPPALELAWRAGGARVTGIVAMAVAAAVVPVLTAWLTKILLDHISLGRDLKTVWPIAVGLAALGLLAATTSALRRYAGAELDRKIGLLSQDRLYRAVNRLPGLARFEDPSFIDRLRLATQAAVSTPGQVFETSLGLMIGTITFAGFFGSLLTISWVMAAAALAGALPALAAEILLSKRRAQMVWELGPVERREIFYSQLISSAVAAKEVRLFGLGDFLHSRMLSERRTSDAEKRRIDHRTMITQFSLGMLSAIISGSGLVWATVQAVGGNLTIGDVVMFVAAIAGVQMNLAGMVTQIASTHQQLTLFQHYRAVVGVEPDLPVRTGRLPEAAGEIELKDVWFRYGPEHPWILRGVNLTIPFGSSVALVGLNGSGKSTLVKLLSRFYDPDDGSILWNGVDLRDVDPAHLRNRITAVYQDYMQYDLTASENIGLGDLEKLEDRQAIENAAHRAGADKIITALPRGYDTMITRFFHSSDDSEGVLLSGGQGQRVAIARGMLRDDRDLLILDEPSSGLDAEAEHEIHSNLRNYRRGRTSLLISHRLGAVRHADVIAVLDEGMITETGTHTDLMEEAGVYARLFKLQSSGYGDEKD
ncbi:ABC transporter ATP-binding protein [Streptosporangium sp. NPDC023615]|uniref:ABC transporter ATP-binding protein n=1 Tax=Streptosporangium sp. NPDC023615 TaxID=3154794 RepID=UPI0034442F1C